MGRFGHLVRAVLCCGVVAGGVAAGGSERMIEDFSGTPEARWAFISDQVMGGVSTGAVALEREGARGYLHLTGDVSTQNRGGFIQARLTLSEALPVEAEGLELTVRGNGQAYYIHIRTGGTVLPWTFYQARFEAGQEWSTLRIPFASFKAEGRLLRKQLTAGAVTSIAVVAYGRDHAADVSVARIAAYSGE
ncbi:CIA30 family protein [Lentibacter sp.]|uniref:CIA30 family protein n=1 Tax=Lentibacter sp. TaxID=2024994 RepID=UPI003F69CB97